MPSQVATAYVQIIPSAQGIGSGITQALGGDAAATSAGNSIGSKLVGTIKGVIAAAGIGAALGKALTEGAALEQSIGGVKTLFKDSSSQVIANAEKAFQTAGVSANDYMEQVTSFSATLLQGLGEDTAAAAQVADKAIVQMADNANKMGTSMESIQYAYQGFAKDNYTMLDNLKLGYGGTQSEMARLINDSGVLGDSVKVTAETVKDVPFDKIIEAIGIIQDDLGITGTAAQEAATTLSGSMASVQAAFSNVLANLTLGRDVGPALNGLATTITQFLTANLLPAIWNIMTALPGALVTFVQALGPQLMAGMQTLLTQIGVGATTTMPQLAQMFVTGFSTILPQVVSVGTEMVQNIGSGLVQGIPAFLAQALPLLLQFTASLRANFGNIVDAGIELILNLVQGIANALPTLIEYVPQIVSNIAGLINDNAPKILAAGVQIIITLVKGLINAVPTIIANIPTIIKAIADTITAFNWINLGATVVKAIGNGLLSMAGGLKNMMSSTLSGALDYIKSLPGQAIQWGKDMIQGFISGITNSIGGIVGAVKNVGSTIASYLHFSRPDVGPLRMYEQWMPDMMTGLAKGITDNVYRVTAAVGGLNSSMAAALQSNAMQASQIRSAISGGNMRIGAGVRATSSSEQNWLYELREIAYILQEILEAVYGIHIGDDVIGRANDRYRADQAMMKGGAY